MTQSLLIAYQQICEHDEQEWQIKLAGGGKQSTRPTKGKRTRR